MTPPVKISTRGRIAPYGFSRKVGSERRLLPALRPDAPKDDGASLNDGKGLLAPLAAAHSNGTLGWAAQGRPAGGSGLGTVISSKPAGPLLICLMETSHSAYVAAGASFGAQAEGPLPTVVSAYPGNVDCAGDYLAWLTSDSQRSISSAVRKAFCSARSSSAIMLSISRRALGTRTLRSATRWIDGR